MITIITVVITVNITSSKDTDNKILLHDKPVFMYYHPSSLLYHHHCCTIITAAPSSLLRHHHCCAIITAAPSSLLHHHHYHHHCCAIITAAPSSLSPFLSLPQPPSSFHQHLYHHHHHHRYHHHHHHHHHHYQLPQYLLFIIFNITFSYNIIKEEEGKKTRSKFHKSDKQHIIAVSQAAVPILTS